MNGEITSLVTLTEGKPVTSSLTVAKVFGKQHPHILRAIRELECSQKFNASNFGLVEYTDSKGEKRPYYTISRDGFAFLAMGFTGKKAAQFKEAYIFAFNEMEKALKYRIEKENETLLATLREENYLKVKAEFKVKQLEEQMSKISELALPSCRFGEESETTGQPRDLFVKCYLRSSSKPHVPHLETYVQLLLPLETFISATQLETCK